MKSRFLEATALDWFLVLLRPKKYFPYSSRSLHTDVIQIESRLHEVDPSSLDEIIKKFEERFEEEEKRHEQIESKARALQGFTALAGSLVVGFNQFLIGTTDLDGSVRLFVIFVYICVAISLLMVVSLAQKAVGTATYVRPNFSDWLDLRDRDKESFKKQYTIDLYSSILQNSDTNSDKGTFLNGAQDWMRNVIWMLVIFIFVQVFAIANSQPQNESIGPIDVIIVTPTSTATLTPTLTPTATTTPTATSTPIPTMTSTATNTP